MAGNDDIKLSCVTEEDSLSRFARIVDLQEVIPAIKEDPGSAAKNSKGASSSSLKRASASGRVTEDEIRAVLLDKAPVTTYDLVAKFKSRLRTKEDKDAFAIILTKISKLQKTNGPNYYVVLRGKQRRGKRVTQSSKPAPATGRVTEDEIRAVLLHKAPVTTQDLVAKFKSRLRSKEDKGAFAVILRKISRLEKTNGPNYYVVLRGKRKG